MRGAVPRVRRRPALITLALLAAAVASFPKTASSAASGESADEAVVAPVDSLGAARRSSPRDSSREEPFRLRSPEFGGGDRWVGLGIAYGPFRDGQRPGGSLPTREQLREDLHLLVARWPMLRLYGSTEPTPAILEIIRQDSLALRVVLGVWIEPEERTDERGRVEERFPEKAAANRAEIESAVRLAGEYPELVHSVCVGNETQVSWSSHRCPPGLLIGFVREMRARTDAPVTTADDFAFWTAPQSEVVARELDYLTAHLHPMWNGRQQEEALGWMETKLGEIRAVHPGRVVVIGETGWATRRSATGEQARLIRGEPGEPQQKRFYDSLNRWVGTMRVPTFFFEAFDENWKGGEDPDEVEKHWGLFRADRTLKKALSDER